MTLHHSAAKFLIRNRVAVLSFWAIVGLVSVYHAPALFKCFELSIVHNDDTESGRASEILRSGLPDYKDRMEDVVVVWCDDCDTVVGKESRRVMSKLSGYMEAVKQRYPDLIKAHEGYYDLEDVPNNPHIAPDKKAMLFHWSFTMNSAIREGYELFNAEVEQLNRESSLHIVSSGPYANFRAAEREMVGFVVSDEMIVVPIIAFILWFMLGSVSRSIVPFACAGLSILTTWSSLLLIKKVIWPEFNMVITLPFMSAALCVALCVDYGLFLWGRFGEERSRGVILEEAIARMLGFSGHVVVVSGAVMMLAYFSVLWYPHSNSINLFAMGVANILAALYSVVTSLTITPCIIATFPQTFDADTSEHERLFRRMKPGKYWKKWAVMITKPPWIVLVPMLTYLIIAPVAMQLQNYQESYNTFSLMMVHSTPEYAGHEIVEKQFPRGTTMPMMVALQLSDHSYEQPQLQQRLSAKQLLKDAGEDQWWPGAAQLFQNPLKNFKNLMARGRRNNPASMLQLDGPMEMGGELLKQGMENMENLMKMAPSSSQSDKANPLQSEEFYTYACALVKSIIAETKGKSYQIDPDDVLSLYFLPPNHGGGAEGRCMSYQVAQMLLSGDGAALEHFGVPNNLNVIKLYQKAFGKLANTDGQVSVMLFRPKYDPMGPTGTEVSNVIRRKVLPQYRGVLQIDGRSVTADSYFVSILTLMMDVQAQLYGSAPRILGLTILAMFVSIAFMFRSAFVPIKLVMTVVIPLTFVYGAAVAVFQNGALNWLGIEQLRSMGGVSWEMPLFTFCVLMGLALDYDIFLFARVYEYRQMGYDNRSAVVKGMCATGPTISAAGSIMALAFVGNMMGPFGYDNQLGFIMCVGVLVDTFVIRMCLVPCFLCMLESLNYWPMKMPPPTKVDKCIMPNAKDSDFELPDEE